jgi:hypothetical protein
MKLLPLLVSLVLAFALPLFAEPVEAARADQTAAEKVSREMYEKAVRESQLRAAARYPDARKSGSPLDLALKAETDRLWKEQSPLLRCSEWPEYVAAKLAADLGILPVRQAP